MPLPRYGPIMSISSILMDPNIELRGSVLGASASTRGDNLDRLWGQHRAYLLPLYPLRKLTSERPMDVVELPEIVAEGRRVAVREEAAGLGIQPLSRAAPAIRDVLVSAGTFQYMERSIPSSRIFSRQSPLI